MTSLDLRPLVLAAGRGQRLRPLTDIVPKPLLSVLGRPLAGHSLRRLREFGCDRSALNLHHLADAVERGFGKVHEGLALTYSREAQLLGTLGALGPLHDYFEGADLALILNGDSLCLWPLEELLRRHQESGAAATLLVSTRADPEAFGGGVGLDAQDRIVSFRSGEGDEAQVVRRAVFAGAHILSAEVVRQGLDVAAGGVADFVQQLYKPLLAAGARLQALPTSVNWFDLGTPRRYLEGVLGHLHAHPGDVETTADGSWIETAGPGGAPHVADSARITASVIEAGVEVADRARVDSSLLLAGCQVGAGAEVRNSIVAPGVELPPLTRLDQCLVTSSKVGCRARENDTQFGGLILTPMLQVA